MRWIMLTNDTFSRGMSCNQINGLSLVAGIGSCAFAVPILWIQWWQFRVRARAFAAYALPSCTKPSFILRSGYFIKWQL